MSKGALQPCDPEGAQGGCCPPVIGRVIVADPGGPGEQIFLDGFIDVTQIPTGPNVLRFATLKLDNGSLAEVRNYTPPVASGPPSPSVTVQPSVVAVPGAMDETTLTLNVPPGLLGSAHWELVFTNTCGCCAIVHLETGAA